MNEHDEREELGRLLPAVPAERGLTAERHSHHKDVLMQLIDQDHRSHQGNRDRQGHQVQRDQRSRRPSRILQPALLAGAVAVALAAGLTVGVGAGGDAGSAPDRAAVSDAPSGGSRSAVGTLDRIAAVAMRTDVGPVRDGQFVYVRTRVSENESDWGKPVKPGALHDREVWFSQKQGPLVEYGLIRENGDDFPIRILVPKGSDGEAAGIDRPTYAWLASLPTDPGALLKKLYAETPVSEGEDRDQAVFQRIGELVAEQLLPSATAAAIYQATARIPGVTEVSDAVDAAGRHGIAIAREDTRMGLRTEWIFDPGTLGYLGERSVLTRTSAMGRAGTVFDTRAVLERAVVDKRGQEPGERRRASRS
jgi:hypothetical protein